MYCTSNNINRWSYSHAFTRWGSQRSFDNRKEYRDIEETAGLFVNEMPTILSGIYLNVNDAVIGVCLPVIVTAVELRFYDAYYEKFNRERIAFPYITQIMY